SDEAVASTRDRLDKARLIGRLAEGVAQFLNGRVDAMVELDDGVVRPQSQPDLVAQHDVAGMIEHHDQNPDRLLAQLDADAALAQFPRPNIEFEGPKTIETRWRSVGHDPRALRAYHRQRPSFQ